MEEKAGQTRDRPIPEDMARLEVEIYEEKVRVWVAGAKAFIEDKGNKELVVDIIVKALDKWLDVKRAKLLERLGLYFLGAIALGALAVLGWKGWGGK